MVFLSSTRFSLSPPLRAHLLCPRCRRREVSSTSGHRSSFFVTSRQCQLLHVSSPQPLHLQIVFSAFIVMSLLRHSRLSVLCSVSLLIL
ncbi:hypothetical protein F2Q69_00012646 [Brassica cretica]|uniref:Uncharacterized protein n=1 Tax=Brassica cretica TaxID=69181 RepID=A0A8S9R1D1_BRACR|nr:hypothetical protein F2Q69_00012646 [Brassica cretica]